MLRGRVRDQGNSFTGSSASPESGVCPGADRTSLMAVLPHDPGSYCRVLSRFAWA
ncbi:MAG: hypothetical protein ACLTYN_16695 [Dysosmobacter welbionis]